MNISIVLKGASATKSILEYLGIIEELQKRMAAKLDRLADSEFEAGLRSLEQACHSLSERASLLREARSRLNKAIGLEKGYRLALTYLGLALCHQHLEDGSNARRALSELNELPYSITRRQWSVAFARDYGSIMAERTITDTKENLGSLKGMFNVVGQTKKSWRRMSEDIERIKLFRARKPIGSHTEALVMEERAVLSLKETAKSLLSEFPE